jgi:hypothetical protein
MRQCILYFSVNCCEKEGDIKWVIDITINTTSFVYLLITYIYLFHDMLVVLMVISITHLIITQQDAPHPP